MRQPSHVWCRRSQQVHILGSLVQLNPFVNVVKKKLIFRFRYLLINTQVWTPQRASLIRVKFIWTQCISGWAVAAFNLHMRPKTSTMLDIFTTCLYRLHLLWLQYLHLLLFSRGKFRTMIFAGKSSSSLLIAERKKNVILLNAIILENQGILLLAGTFLIMTMSKIFTMILFWLSLTVPFAENIFWRMKLTNASVIT